MELLEENILIVDDDINILELVQRHLQSLNYHTYKAVSVKQALAILKDTAIDLLLTDIQMPDVDGLELIKYVSEHYPHIPKLVITGFPSVAGALNVIKSGASDYLTKPFTKEELKVAVKKSLENVKPLKLAAPKTSHQNLNIEMIGNSAAFSKVKDIINRVKDNKASILVLGESGTGKELVSRAIHYSGKFSNQPFIAVNCAAIPENLLEAELFGYTKGAFTGANENRNGFFQAAHKGTLFLDEIGNASLAVQAKLLRALQEKEITKVGSQKVEKIDARIIAATNENLTTLIEQKKFREDLYYRLTVVEILVPPLRERKEDIKLLVTKFLKKYGIEYKDRLLNISQNALAILERYNWPGNIRELENVIQHAVIMSDGIIDVENLPNNLKFQINFPESSLKSLAEIEKEYIQRVLSSTNNNKTKAAEILQIDRKTLREKLK
ncbi:sigma-54-dependent transcriptional regulator [Cellulophaga tyrosinoxydans]|uniref:DNA-binding transcriptional response regulator, NtrC family, contains REC, AAA-type ATPase, and a Fis-type DNA-binding domains n=1 Tax=Cellulophaga tyrosinoxydans TaxID=504486 RepID=A0A1W1Z7U9_9FLAO|nr:sigma-54 dependent transcriptional regulator [Cellulophaga tyrosinoxydans]SMC44557.1 DNA-binding transcriptional response regulator, NtrC family, contains REC, AAA-type ATPase, and a Fis-type DNA-binding domains [Cellulophaga tyrosinoxydans]